VDEVVMFDLQPSIQVFMDSCSSLKITGRWTGCNGCLVPRMRPVQRDSSVLAAYTKLTPALKNLRCIRGTGTIRSRFMFRYNRPCMIVRRNDCQPSRAGHGAGRVRLLWL